MLLIVDCKSQVTHNIARRVREHERWAKIVPYTKTWEEILALKPEAIVVSGGPNSVYKENAPVPDLRIFKQTEIPVLNICYGLHLMTQALGGRVAEAEVGEYGSTNIVIEQDSEFFHGFPSDITVHMSHRDHVAELPSGVEVIARSANRHVAAMRYRNLFGVQFHPEMDLTQDGRIMLGNFLHMHNTTKDWDHSKVLERIVDDARALIGNKKGVLGASGGVDSTLVNLL